jgi:two-component system chemotaxis response regulator CheY
VKTDIHILLVDDFKLMLTVCSKILNGIGFEHIGIAYNGKEAWDRLQSEEFDLLITDWDMPEMDGGELIAMVRQDPRLKELPILVITGEVSFRDQALEVGANSALIKPFYEVDLRETLESMLS